MNLKSFLILLGLWGMITGIAIIFKASEHYSSKPVCNNFNIYSVDGLTKQMFSVSDDDQVPVYALFVNGKLVGEFDTNTALATAVKDHGCVP